MTLEREIRKFFKGEVLRDAETLTKYSRDASLFEIRPELVVAPKDAEDVKRLVSFAGKAKAKFPNLSLTARSAGTDMTGAAIGESVVVDFTKHMNRVKEVNNEGYAVVEPGAYYRDFERETLKKRLLFPSYPASKEICAMGGIVNNNSGGEKSLIYGKTEDYVESLNVVLADGNSYTLEPLTKKELGAKMKKKGFEGEIYRKTFALIEKHYEAIRAAKPKVSKNSSGYNLWSVWDRKTFNLAKLFVGSQGTLGLTTEAKIRLVRAKPHSGMLVVFLKDLKLLAELVRAVLPLRPSSFESFDDNTLRLALKFFAGFLKLLGAKNLFSLGVSFLPEFWMVVTGGMPKLVLLIEFEGETREEVREKVIALDRTLAQFRVRTRVAATKEETKKYWAMRRESFNLLRNKVQGKQTAPFIDDLIVAPEHLPEFLPRLYEVLDRYEFLYTIAGHVGDGNFHIIPLMTLAREEEREKIPKAADEVYQLVLEYGGSLSAEHNDGLVRGPYLERMFGEKIYKLFKEVKKIFDPKGIFNPGKKIGVDSAYALAHIRKS